MKILLFLIQIFFFSVGIIYGNPTDGIVIKKSKKDYSDYAFYVAFPDAMDKVTGYECEPTALPDGRYIDGRSVGANQLAIADNGYLSMGPGEYNQEIGSSNDLSTDYWTAGAGVTSVVISEGETTITAGASGSTYVRRSLSGSLSWTLSEDDIVCSWFWIKKGTARYVGFRPLLYTADHVVFDWETESVISNPSNVEVIDVIKVKEDEYRIGLRTTILADLGYFFGVCVTNSSGAETNIGSDAGTIIVKGVNLTNSSYLLPFTINENEATQTIPANYQTEAWSNYGPTWLFSADTHNSINDRGHAKWKNLNPDYSFNGTLGGSDDDWWASSSNWSLSDGLAKCDGLQTAATQLYIKNKQKAFVTYECSFDLVEYTAGTLGFSFVNGAVAIKYPDDYSLGRKTLRGRTNSSYPDMNLYFVADADFKGAIDNVVIREIDSTFMSEPLYDAIDGVQDGVSELATNSTFESWTDGSPDGYTIVDNDANNYVEEHADGMRIVGDGTSDIFIYQDVAATPGGYYQGKVTISNHTIGQVRLLVYDATNSQNIYSIIPTLASDGTTFLRCMIPGTCSSFRFGIYGSDGYASDFVISSFSIKEVEPAQGKAVIEWMPKFNYDDGISSTTETFGILSAWDSAENLVSVARDADWAYKSTIQITDQSTTEAISTGFQWQKDTLYTITARWGPHPGYSGATKMQVSVTDGTTTWSGAVVDFDFYFWYDAGLNPGWETGWAQFKSIKIEKDPDW